MAAGLAISGVYDLAPIRETYLDAKLALTDAEIETLSPLRLPVCPKPLCIAYGTAELPALIHDARNLHALRAAAHAPGPLLPVAGAEHFPCSTPCAGRTGSWCGRRTPCSGADAGADDAADDPGHVESYLQLGIEIPSCRMTIAPC